MTNLPFTRRFSPKRQSAAASLSTFAGAIGSGRNSTVLVMGWFLASRLVYALVAVAGGYPFPDALCQWDCHWYLAVAEHGYTPAAASGGTPHQLEAVWAFFPLFPLFIKAVMLIAPIKPVHAALLAANTATLAAGFVAVRYLESTRSRVAPNLLLGWMMLGPGAFYLAGGLSESLFFPMSLAALLAWYGKRFLRAGLFMALLTALRIPGSFIALALGLRELGQTFRARSKWDPERLRAWAALCVAPLGLLLFMLHLYMVTGDPLAFLHVVGLWGRVTRNPLSYLFSGLFGPLLGHTGPGDWARLSQALWSLAGIVLSVYLLANKRYVEGTIGLLAIVVPLTSGLFSMARFVAGTPVFTLAVHDLLSNRSRPVQCSAMLLGIVMNTALLRIWYTGSFGTLVA